VLIRLISVIRVSKIKNQNRKMSHGELNIENPDWTKARHRIIVSGGGTGGHIFPAIAIANALTAKDPTVKVLFVGAEGRMEMEKVPAAGYKIIGLPVRGFNRKNPFKNIVVIYRLVRSLIIARVIIKRFHPDAVVGVGGYASGPVLRAAARKGIPVIIQEQNSYAGVTNKLLAKKADRICVAYDGMERFFPKDKIVFTGNPVRQELNDCNMRRNQSLSFFDLDPGKQTILVVGGSLGARTINQSVEAYLDRFPASLQLIWQTGKGFYERAKEQVQSRKMSNVKVFAFIQRMDLAYAAADLAVSRAGAGTISELSITGKPCILVPSPNVAEDHQTRNAMALVQKKAAIMIRDSEAVEKLMPEAVATVQNHEALEPLADNIKMLAKFHADKTIAEVVIQLIK
jgi:UDP-N-acetylglucosamine--N-acetylmuramyl-(pentapeptide) pyrophosphoryl-undecaprenol N-acetylglucosamine transferase